jgi:heat shock protein HtpX
LEGVIAHELSHIRNRDVRLLIISIVFVGIFSMIAQLGFRSLLYGGGRRSSSNNKNNGAILLIIVVVIAAIGYLLTILMRFAISREREYLADAAAAEMTKNPLALASALRKISGNPNLRKQADDVAQLFIEHAPQKAAFASLFATHPPIKKRIAVLEQF